VRHPASIQNDTGWTFSLPARSAHGSGTSGRTPYSGGGPSKANRRASARRCVVMVVPGQEATIPGPGHGGAGCTMQPERVCGSQGCGWPFGGGRWRLHVRSRRVNHIRRVISIVGSVNRSPGRV
jgi:hypothetical protein